MDADENNDAPPVEIETAPKPAASVIWLHGLGADGHDFEPLVPELHLPARLAVRFVFPHAPQRPVTLNGGHVMRAWYDVALSDRGFMQNEAHIREAESIVRGLIEREFKRGVAHARIVLAGFSQGGLIALHTALRYPETLGGVLALSALAPDVEGLLRGMRPDNIRTPVFLAHGTQDTLAPFSMAEAACRRLSEAGLKPEWHAYPAGHTVTTEEVRDIARWLLAILAAG